MGGAAPSFDLTSRRWLPVRLLDGTEAEFSLREIYDRAGDVRRLVGDLPTQEFALLRLLLALAHDALEGPEDVEAWEELWESGEPFAPVAGYLDRHQDRFDLLHPVAPFYQVADLRTAKDEVASLNRIVADVPNGDPFFTMRAPGVERLSFAEAARWVVHAHAFDPSGIKSGPVGDPRAKAGKGYPQGVAWLGNLGGVLAEGDTLRETLLLNLIAADTGTLRIEKEDRPAWRREPARPGQAGDLDLGARPTGPRDLYTWQSRRLRLHYDAHGVHGVVLAYGDPLAASADMHRSEPMTGWRRSEPQQKKLGRPVIYMPQTHDPARAAWRGLESLLQAGSPAGAAQGRDAPQRLRPRALDWLARLSTEEVLPRGRLIRARTFGAVYGTQQSVIDEVVADHVTLPVVLLHERDLRFGQAAVSAVSDAEAAVNELGDLAAVLAEAAGAEKEPRRSAARDLGFGTLDGPYRDWLRHLAESDDPYRERRRWQRLVHRIVSGLGDQLLDDAGLAAWEGRVVQTRDGWRWLNDAFADLRFRTRLKKHLLDPSPLAAHAPGTPGALTSGVDTHEGPQVTTTASAPNSPPRWRPRRDVVGIAVSKHIAGLQTGYLNDRSASVATLARLRRGVGKSAHEEPDLWGLTGTEALHEECAGGRLPEDLLPQAEEAAHTALTLWSMHQQSHHRERMHVPGGLEFGAAVRRLMPSAEPDEPIRKRFVRAATAPSPAILAQRLRDIVVLLRRDGIALDYGLLADQLLEWQESGGPERVRRSWGRAFHSHRPQQAGGPSPGPDDPADPGHPGDPDTPTDPDDGTTNQKDTP
ncbi:type I-E CRISPR-associated protein Cse1/CasA [Streptomyces specialis]|uniref:type I-E CRISPR-associated protein Cse1/CasA n=1 Tax=Streptomyces specialis TaxID=498367 RepID=UPI00099E817D